jgi:hypothetical protein
MPPSSVVSSILQAVPHPRHPSRSRRSALQILGQPGPERNPRVRSLHLPQFRIRQSAFPQPPRLCPPASPFSIFDFQFPPDLCLLPTDLGPLPPVFCGSVDLRLWGSAALRLSGMRDGHDFMRFSGSTITPLAAGPHGAIGAADSDSGNTEGCPQLFNLFSDALAGGGAAGDSAAPPPRRGTRSPAAGAVAAP